MASEGTTPTLDAEQTQADPASGPVQRDPRKTRIGRILGAIVILVAIATAIGFALTVGVSDSEVVVHVAAVHDLPASRPSPGPTQEVGGLRTLNIESFGWTPKGARLDAVGTHTVATTFFSRGGRVLGISVISGASVFEPGPVVIRPDGVQVHQANIGGRTVLSWRRGGHTLVMSSIVVPTVWMRNLATALNSPRAIRPPSSGAAG